ncbi:MAG: EAL domain-containing protein [Steroidobacteraceae bacterium]|nr:EAL domain-containing protein [Steroidobacteraceae bacterium]
MIASTAQGPPDAARPAAGNGARPGPSPVVLVADDDELARQLVRAALAADGYTVFTAEDGADAVERFRAARPDCVLLDVMMPRMDGFAACSAIRALPEGRAVPVLVLTSRDDPDTVARAYAAGATDFVAKGLNARLLAERVRFLLRASALQRNLVASEARLARAQRMARLGHWELAADGTTLALSPLLPALLGLPAGGLVHRDGFVRALSVDDAPRFGAAFDDCVRHGTRIELDLVLDTGTAPARHLHVEGERVSDAADGGARVALAVQDLTRLRRAEEEARTLAYYDPATRLPNARFARERLRLYVSVAEPPARIGVLVLRAGDADRVIHSLGSRAAEKLLRRTAMRIEEAIAGAGEHVDRTAIEPAAGVPGGTAPSFVAHLGGGEFLVVLAGRGDVAEIEGAAAALVDAVGRPLVLDGEEHSPPARVGIALWPEDARDADGLLERARSALRQVEAADDPGRGSAFYSPELQSRSRHLIALEGALRTARANDELHVAFQPRVELATRRLLGCEALLRWEHPRFGAVPTRDFVEIAERSGLICELGAWVLEAAAQRVADWRRRLGVPLVLSVNVSPRQLMHPLLGEVVDEALARTRLEPGALELELTETGMVESGGVARRVLERVRARGIRVAIDDFGTGYSSLAYLSRLPVDVIKIDRAFTSRVQEDHASRGVVSAVLAIAGAMGARTVAEGIETEGQLELLLALGCDEGQGFLFGRPLSAEEFEERLLNERGGARGRAGRPAGAARR